MDALEGHTGWVHSVVWSSDGLRLATASDDTTVRLWNVKSGAELHRSGGFEHAVRSVAWSPHVDAIAVGAGNAVVVWRPYDESPVVVTSARNVLDDVRLPHVLVGLIAGYLASGEK